MMRSSASETVYRDMGMQYSGVEHKLPQWVTLRPLRASDIDEVVRVEQAAFPANEASPRDKIAYRLDECPELCLGAFLRKYNWNDVGLNGGVGVAASRSTPVSETLVGHVMATKMPTELVTNEAMLIPEVDSRGVPMSARDARGHREDGRAIGIHSLAVHPEWQGRSVGYSLLKDYIQRLYSLHTADGMALICHDNAIPFYEKHGFRDVGKSASTHAGVQWNDMYLSFDSYENGKTPE